jgi:RNA polymerase primary sigma factor
MLSEMGVNVVETEEVPDDEEQQREEAEEEGEVERGELVEVQHKVPAKAEAKEPAGRTDDPVRMCLNEIDAPSISSLASTLPVR